MPLIEVNQPRRVTANVRFDDAMVFCRKERGRCQADGEQAAKNLEDAIVKHGNDTL